jgi:hypothetical protein
MDVEIYCECGRILTVVKYQYRADGIGYFYAEVRPCYVCARPNKSLEPTQTGTPRSTDVSPDDRMFDE